MVCGRFCRRLDRPRERCDAALAAAGPELGLDVWSLFGLATGMFLDGSVLGRSGSDLLSRVLRRSTIGARGFHGRVRDGIGCLPPAITTRSSKHVPLLFYSSKSTGTHLSSAACSGLSLFVMSLSFPDLYRQGVTWLFAGRCRCVWWADQAYRAISTSQLNVLPRLHPWPIDVMVYHGSQARPGFEGGFPLRCFQRLSRPYIATLRCRWRDNRYTRGTSIPVLSY